MAHYQERSGDRSGVHGELHGVHGGDESAELDQRRRIVGHVHAGLHLRQPDLQQHLPADFDHKVRQTLSSRREFVFFFFFAECLFCDVDLTNFLHEHRRIKQDGWPGNG